MEHYEYEDFEANEPEISDRYSECAHCRAYIPEAGVTDCGCCPLEA